MSDQNICISDPSLPSCVDWYPPDDLILPKLEALCRSMPEMPACSLKSYCDNFSKVLIGDHLCLPFSLYSDVCKLDMPGMPDCRVKASL